MKNLKILLCLFIACQCVHAQPWYGQFYYPHAGSQLSSAQRTFWAPGYLMGGFTPISTITTPNFVIDKMDAGGFETFLPEFSNEYFIIDTIDCSQFASKKASCVGIDVIETRPLSFGRGERYALAGAYNNGVFFATLDNAGMPICTFRWDFPAINPATSPNRPSIYESRTIPGQYYICGAFDRQTYVVKVNANVGGAIAAPMWKNFYNTAAGSEARALIESPYNPSELIVVGRYYISGWGSDAYIMNLSAITGAVNSFTAINHSWDSDDWFSSIEPANSVTGGSNGYILGGHSFYYMTAPAATIPRVTSEGWQQWMCKVDQQGGIIWSSLIKPTTAAGTLNREGEISDIFERYNTNTNPPQYEYYGAGNYNSITPNVQPELVVYKLDDSGLDSHSPDEFHFTSGHGVGSFPIASAELTMIETGGGNDDGFQVYGTGNTPGNHYMVKAYFNGVSGCRDNQLDIDQIIPGPDSIRTIVVDGTDWQVQCNLFSLTVNKITLGENDLCYTVSIAAGSNMRLQSTDIDEKVAQNDLLFFPSPTSGKVNLKFGEEKKYSVFHLSDNTGQVLYNYDLLPKDQNEGIELDLQRLQIKPGVYYLELRGAKEMKTIKLVLTE